MLLFIYTLTGHENNTARVIAENRTAADTIMRSWNLMQYVTHVSETPINFPYVMLTFEPKRVDF